MKALFLIDNETSEHGFANYIKASRFKQTTGVYFFNKVDKNNAFDKSISVGKVSQKFKKDSKKNRISSLKSFFAFLLIPALCFRFFFRIIASKKILDEYKPDQIYISSDRIYANGFFQPFLCAALRYEKQIFILQVADFADEERMVRQRMFNESFEPSILTRIFFKNYIFSSNEAKVQYYPFHILCVLKFFSILPENPKFVGTTEINNLILFNKSYLNKVPQQLKSKLRYTLLEESITHRDITNIQSLGLALPQFFEHGFCVKEDAWALYDELFKEIAKLNCDVFIFLHPKMNKNEYAPLIEKYNLKIYNNESLQGLDEIDLFVNCFSSLTHNAIKRCIPTVIYDPLGLNYQMFNSYDSLIYVNSAKDLSWEVNKLQANRNYLDTLLKKLSKDSKKI